MLLRLLLFSVVLVFVYARYGTQIKSFAKQFIGKSIRDYRSRNLKSFGIYTPEQYTIHGIDVSHHQQDIDWKDVANMNIKGLKFSFVFMKATEGDAHLDTQFAKNWREAKSRGLIRGAYHFYQPNIKSTWQAEHFIQTVPLESGDLPPVLDIEIMGKYSEDNMRRGLKNWLNIIEEHYHIRPILYTNLNFYRNYLEGHFEDYPLWIAQYNRREMSFPRHKWHFWQYSNQGRVNGIAGDVDFNAFRGNVQALKEMCLP